MSTVHKFRMGDPPWVLRAQPMGAHCTKTWFTPEEVVCRIVEDMYRINVGPRQFTERQQTQLLAPDPDIRGKHVSLDYTDHEADSYNEYAEQNDYTVEKILAQHLSAPARGGVHFKVRWRGYEPSDDTSEPVSSFVPRISTPFMEYVCKHKIKLQLSDLEPLTKAIVAIGD